MNRDGGQGRLSVEPWSPDYGAPLETREEQSGPAHVDVDVEVPAAAWEPRRPPEVRRAPVAFVDGVRRVDANLMWTTDDGAMHSGMAASVAAGVVVCNGRAEITRLDVERVLLLDVETTDIVTRHGRWTYRPTRAGQADPGQLSIELQQVMADLEVAAATAAGEAGELAMVVIDGPIRRREQIPRAVGHIKTHHHQYLPPTVAAIMAELRVGDRTPLFAIGPPFPRLSWYLRLPGPQQHPWSGVVRNEIALCDLSEAQALADRAAATLGRFASTAARDARAPQNLTPVGGLEARLRHRLGDAMLAYRALRVALA